MKKILSVILVLAMMLSLASCGGEDATKPGAEPKAAVGFDGTKYNLDLTGKDAQPMSDEKATVEVLAETAEVWLEGNTIFAYSDNKKTYEEFVEHIGCEPSEYQYKESSGNRMFIWRASDDDTAWFCAEFEESDGAWELNSTGSANLGIVK